MNATILKDLALLMIKSTGEEREKIKLKNQKKGVAQFYWPRWINFS
jgi:hypothetical protein